MGHGHSHRAGQVNDVEVAAGPRTVLLSVLAAAFVVTVVCLVSLWPNGDEVDDRRGSVSFAGEDVTFPLAVVEAVAPACASVTESEDGCGTLEVTVTEGVDEGAVVVWTSRLR